MTDHNQLEIEMVELKTDMKYIKKSIDSYTVDNKLEHKEILLALKEFVETTKLALNEKANIAEVEAIKVDLTNLKNKEDGKTNNMYMWVISILLAILGFLIARMWPLLFI